jgi:hypothetical protein
MICDFGDRNVSYRCLKCAIGLSFLRKARPRKRDRHGVPSGSEHRLKVAVQQ